MKTEKLPAELTAEETANYEKIASEIAKKYAISKVNVYVGLDSITNERVVAFIKEPTFLQKMYAMDKLTTLGAFASGNELRETLTLKEESNPLTYGDGTECDKYKMGIVTQCIQLIEVAQNILEKK
jgi:hypothetical protein